MKSLRRMDYPAITPECRMKGMFREALEAYLNVLRAYSLADALENGPALAALLEIPGADNLGALN